MHFPPIYREVTSAFLWTAFINILPGVDAALTENRLALTAFCRVQNHVRANLADKEIGPLLFFRVGLHQVLDLKMVIFERWIKLNWSVGKASQIAQVRVELFNLFVFLLVTQSHSILFHYY
jgi:hypothetical protein